MNNLKKYCLALLSIDYSLFLFIPSIILFVVMYFYTKQQIQPLRYVIIAIAIFLAILLFVYNTQKFKIRRSLRQISNPSDYDECAYLGKSFLAEKRLLAYQKQSVKEYYYDHLKTLRYEKNSKDKDLLQCEFEEGNVTLETASYAQAKRTCAFLKTQNPNIIFEGIEPEGSGTLRSIEYPEVKNEEA